MIYHYAAFGSSSGDMTLKYDMILGTLRNKKNLQKLHKDPQDMIYDK